MISKLFFSLFFILLSVSSYSQKNVLEHPIHLKSLLIDKREAFPIKSNSGDSLVLFLLDESEINAILVNKDYEVIKELSFPRPEIRINDIIIGYKVVGSQYSIFYTNKNKSHFSSFTVDFESDINFGNEIELKLTNEKYLEAINYEDNFYIISVKKNSSDISLYEFSDHKSFTRIPFSFGNIKFQNDFPTLYHLLSETNGLASSLLKIEKLSTGAPVSLQTTFHFAKLYYFDQKIVITLDNIYEETTLLILDLKTRTPIVKRVNKAKLENGETTNSLIYKDKLFQIVVSNDECILEINDFNSGEKIKEFYFNQESEIPFQNGPIIQEGGSSVYTVGVVRELSKNKQLLRKMAGSTIAISLNEASNNQIQITIGSFEEFTGGGGGGGMMYTGMRGGAGGVPTPTYNIFYHQYNSYSFTKSAYVSGLLDSKTFDHVSGEVLPSKFKLIKKFEESLVNKSPTTIFSWDNSFIFGYYNKSNRKYYLARF